MTLRISIRIGRPPVANEPLPLFNMVVTHRRPNFWTLAESVAVHVILLAAATFASKYWPQPDEVIDYSKYRVETIRLRLDDPLYFTASRTPDPPRQPEKVAAAAKGATAALTEGGREPASSPGAPVVPRRLQLPVPREIAKDAPVILQPEYRPNLTMPTALPPLAFWARDVKAPKPKPREFVTPGRVEAAGPPPQLAAAPVLAVPNRQSTVADVNISLPPVQAPVNPAIVMPNSTTIPVRLRDATETQAASFERQEGQAVNVLAMSSERDFSRTVNIPRGLQNIPRSAAADGNGAAGEGRKGIGPADSTGAGNPASANQNAGSGAGNNPRAGASGSVQSANSNNPSPGAGSGSGRQVGGTSASPAADNANGRSNTPGTGPNSTATTPGAPNTALASASGTSPSSAATAPRPARTTEATRIQHPVNGSFDVVIMQAASRDDLPDLGGMLSGNPVYTVYLRVGDRKEWLLEYCVPARQSSQSNPYEISVDDAGAITPPYPINTSIPNTILSANIPKHIVVRGLLTATGSIRAVKADANNPIIPELMALLNEWRFRPALKNKEPIEVEILLVIPARV